MNVLLLEYCIDRKFNFKNVLAFVVVLAPGASVIAKHS